MRVESVIQVVGAFSWLPTLAGVLLVTRSQRRIATDARADDRAVRLETEHRRAYESWGAAIETVVIATERWSGLTRRFQNLAHAERMSPGAHAPIDATIDAASSMLEREAAARVMVLLVEQDEKTRTQVTELATEARDLSPHAAMRPNMDPLDKAFLERVANLRRALTAFLAGTRLPRR